LQLLDFFVAASKFSKVVLIVNTIDFFVNKGFENLKTEDGKKLLGKLNLDIVLKTKSIGIEGFSDMLQGFGKNFANGAIAIGSIQAILLSLWISAPYASINIFLTSIFSQSDLVIPAVLYLVFGLQLFLFSRQIGNFRWTIMILYPLHALFFLYVFVYSFFRIYIFKNNTWKGRKV
jgi:hypothetical protein